MQITITNTLADTELSNIQADDYLEQMEYDNEWEDILNQLDNTQDDEIIFNHSDGSKYIIRKEIEIFEI